MIAGLFFPFPLRPIPIPIPISPGALRPVFTLARNAHTQPTLFFLPVPLSELL